MCVFIYLSWVFVVVIEYWMNTLGEEALSGTDTEA